MAYAKIPVNCSPNTFYTCTVSLKNNTVNLNLRLLLNYSDFYDYWYMDVYVGSELKVAGVPLVLGGNMLAQYEYLDIGEAYILREISNNLMHPDNNTLGTKFILVWGDST